MLQQSHWAHYFLATCANLLGWQKIKEPSGKSELNLRLHATVLWWGLVALTLTLYSSLLKRNRHSCCKKSEINQGPFSIWIMIPHLPLPCIFMPPPIFPHKTTNSQILHYNLPGRLAEFSTLVSLQGAGDENITLGNTDLADNGPVCCWKRKLSGFFISPPKPYLHRPKVSPLSRWRY